MFQEFVKLFGADAASVIHTVKTLGKPIHGAVMVQALVVTGSYTPVDAALLLAVMVDPLKLLDEKAGLISATPEGLKFLAEMDALIEKHKTALPGRAPTRRR